MASLMGTTWGIITSPFSVAGGAGTALSSNDRFNKTIDWIVDHTVHGKLEEAQKKGKEEALNQKHEQGLKSITQALVTYRESYVPRTKHVFENLEEIASGRLSPSDLMKGITREEDKNDDDLPSSPTPHSVDSIAKSVFDQQIKPSAMYKELREAIKIRYDGLVLDFGATGPAASTNPFLPTIPGKTPHQVAVDTYNTIVKYEKLLKQFREYDEEKYGGSRKGYYNEFDELPPFEQEQKIHSLVKETIPLFKDDVGIFVQDIDSKIKDAYGNRVKRGAQIAGGLTGTAFIVADILTGGGNTMQFFEALHNIPVLGTITQFVDQLPLVGDLVPYAIDVGALGVTTSLAGGALGAAITAPTAYVPLAQDKTRFKREEELTERKALDAIGSTATDLLHDVNLIKGRLNEKRSQELRLGRADKVDGILSVEAAKETTIEDMAKGLK